METLRASLVSAGRNIEMNRKLVKVAENRYEKSMIEFELNRITPISHFETRTLVGSIPFESIASSYELPKDKRPILD